MSSEVAPFDAKQSEIARYLGLDVRDPKAHAAMAVCDRYKLDPILKHVVVIPKGGVYITRDGLLHVAHMSGQLDGIVVEASGETEQEWWAEVSVHRKDMRFPFRYKGRYSKSGGNKQYGPEMALKCAEALALRRAFDVTGLPVLEERDAAPAGQRGIREGGARPTTVVSTARLVPVHAPTAQETTVDTITGEIVEFDPQEAIDDAADEATGGRLASREQLKAIHGLLAQLNIDNADDGLAMISDVCGEPVTATKELTAAQASLVEATLAQLLAQSGQDAQ